MKNKKFISCFLAICFFSFLFVFSGCTKKTDSYELTLEVWGVFDDSDSFKDINKNFINKTLKVKDVKYKKISSNANEYEKELIDAIASGKAPDVVFFKNTWLPKHKEKFAPLPDSDTYLIKKKNEFVDVFYQDFVEEDRESRKVYAMPLYCDTLALYYNKDMFNQAGIAYPPKTWDEVKDHTKKLTRIDNFGNITQSAIALGRSKDPGAINRSTDILALMMMQNGTAMNTDKIVTFNKSLYGDVNPGLSSLKFYAQFAQGDSDVYTWNTKMDYSIDSFRYRRVAMMINYSHMYDRLKKMDPKLNFDIAPVPQVNLDRNVNHASYWGLAVTKNKQPTSRKYGNDDRIKEAWKYVKYATNKPSRKGFDPGKSYLDITNKVAARKDLLEEQRNENFRGVFAEQAFTAKSWRQPDDTAVEDIMANMINDTVSGNLSANQALETAVSRINVLWK
ncbi:MAG: extracellular solute-binding protein [Patescibacteria group bacterium]|nr:extracellular solute-binding protein [Patescibacteria group bacterium]